MKINLKIFVMMLLLAIIVAIAGANLIYYWQTDTRKENKPLVLQPRQGEVAGQNRTVVTAPVASMADSPVDTGGVTVVPLIPDPVNTVYDFYDYVKNKDCGKAKAIRPDYDTCQEVDGISRVSVKPLQAEGNRAAVELELAYSKKGKPETFDGYVWLKRGVDGHWQIQPYPIPKDKITAEEFLQGRAGITPKAMTDAASPDTSDKLETSLDQLANQPVEDKPAAPETAGQEAKPETEANEITASPEENVPPLPPVAEQIDPLKTKSFGSQKILNACWSPDQLRGSPADKQLNKITPDHSPPDRLFSRHQLKPLQPDLQGSIRTVLMPDPGKKLAALTFDLCEQANEVTGYDAELVNYLRDHNIKATFYAGGKWMRSHPEKAKQLMADPQFEIGNHAWTHGNMRVLSGDELQNQVRWTQTQYELLWEELAQEAQQYGVSSAEINKIPPLPLSFRYPYGTCGVEALDFMAEQGLPSIQWNIVTADPWGGQTADGIAKTILQGIKPGSIIIAHANGRGRKTSDSLPRFVPQLREKGYEFVTVTELLQQGVEVNATNECFEVRPGDNLHYDKKFGKGTE
ncbi:MAG: polysaccharide deacetylase family protein [Gammaproteobacteria bacterium]|nr:polysaccharide deacetylase family protein [Gammaproteobacteria bacterium]MBU1724986.1 polysaccharide deacetylase family protein [Gammaproteobacteria bacterium]MBU2007096.1 polysaccharide deacetylase family protein [Gammaproteobacteria bacterium]